MGFQSTKNRKLNRAMKEVALVAALTCLVAVPTAGAATVLTLTTGRDITGDLQGAVCQAPNNCVPVPYPSIFIPLGVKAIDTAIDSTPGPKVVFAYSGGAGVVAQYLAQHANDPDAPSPDQLSFVLIGNPTRKYGGSGIGANSVLPQTQYQVIDITQQYDPVSDVPDDPFNFLAFANSIAGFSLLHLDYGNVDINDPANTVFTEGNTTYVFVPTENLPLLEPLRALGLSALADQLNGPLKAMIERGYDRSYLNRAESPLPPITPPAQTLRATTAAPATVASGDSAETVISAPKAAESAREATARPDRAGSNDASLRVADTPTTTPPPDSADVADTANPITPSTKQSRPKAAAKHAKRAESGDAQTISAQTPSTTDGKKAEAA